MYQLRDYEESQCAGTKGSESVARSDLLALGLLEMWAALSAVCHRSRDKDSFAVAILEDDKFVASLWISTCDPAP